MRLACLLLLLAAASGARSQDAEIQRALVQRDQMTAEFAAQVRGAPAQRDLETLHAKQLREASLPLSGDPDLARQLRPYQREVMDRERAVLQFAPPVLRAPPSDSGVREALPLPRWPAGGVDAVASDGLRR